MAKLSTRQKQWIERTVAADRSYKKIVYTRFFICLGLALLQVAVFVLPILWLGTHWWAFNLVVSGVGLVFVFYIFSRTDKPSTKLSWILLILLFPVVGVPTYLAYGDGRSMKKLGEKIAKATEENRRELTEIGGFVGAEEGTGDRFLERAGFPAFGGGEVVYYPTGKEAFEEMMAAIEGAEKYILMEYFIIAGGKMWERMLSTLLKKAMEGVKIFLLYDDFGSLFALPQQYDKYLESLHENIRAVTFNPVKPFLSGSINNRDHRKMLVVDGKVAFTGGLNIADEYIDEKKRFGYWKDTAIGVTGEGVFAFVVAFFNLYNAFREREKLTDFLPKGQIEQKGEGIIQPFDDMPGDNLAVAETVYLNALGAAKEYFYVTTPYLVLDDFMRSALCQAAMRGVDVRIVTPAVPDKKAVFRLTRANYEILLKAGVKIYEYSPGFIHAKSFVSDGAAVVGTVNLDYRSFNLHFENAVYFTGKEVYKVKADLEEVFTVSKRITKEGCKRGFLGRLVDAFLRVFETLM